MNGINNHLDKNIVFCLLIYFKKITVVVNSQKTTFDTFFRVSTESFFSLVKYYIRSCSFVNKLILESLFSFSMYKNEKDSNAPTILTLLIKLLVCNRKMKCSCLQHVHCLGHNNCNYTNKIKYMITIYLSCVYMLVYCVVMIHNVMRIDSYYNV